MTVEVICPNCSGQFKVAEQHIGKRAKCPKCSERFIIAAPEDDEPVLADLDWQSPLPIPVSLPPEPVVSPIEVLPPQQPQFVHQQSVSGTKPKTTNGLSQVMMGCVGIVFVGIIGFCGCAGLIGALLPDPGSSEGTSASTTTNGRASTAIEREDNFDKVAAWTMATQFVEDRLKSPGTASYGGLFSGDYQSPRDCVVILGDNVYEVTGWVDSQNGFGATVRTHFSMKLKSMDNGKWALVEDPVMVQR